MRLAWLLCTMAVAAVRAWWRFWGEHGVEADDPDKERETLRHAAGAHGLFRGRGRRRDTG
ncbi:MAG TPA: hypothetical protein PKM57_16955 [Kiritimatiellia bacterium]|nr:hypothetical protein [Kiritimatiellia bacterium]HPS08765.1 hypothetical protein [Kiritimatiellia bacterium]